VRSSTPMGERLGDHSWIYAYDVAAEAAAIMGG
jgi:hypothetical protein